MKHANLLSVNLLVSEWRYAFSQPLIKICLCLTPILAFMLASGSEAESLLVATQYSFMAILMLISPLLLDVVAPIVTLRDSKANMLELIGCTPVGEKRRLWLRYVSLVGLLLAIEFLAYGAVMLAYSLKSGFSLQLIKHALASFVLLALPSVFFNSALMLWVAAKSQSTMVLYVVVGVWGIGYLLLASMAGSPILAGSSIVSDGFYQAMLWLDPYGITAMQQGISNTDIAYSATLLINRLLFCVLGLAVAFFAIYFQANSSFELRAKNDEKLHKATSLFASRMLDSAILQLCALPFLMLIKNRVTQVILLAWPLIIGNQILSGSYYHMPNVASQLNSIDALNLVAFDVLPVLGAFIIALWCWFVCCFDKRQNIEQLTAVLPVSSRQLVLAQVLALSLMIMILLLLTVLGGIVAQLILGSELILSHYMVQLSLTGLPLLLLAMVFIAIYHLCRSSSLAGLIVLSILVVKFTPITTAFGLTHTLWNIADTPLQEPDSFWGYGASLSVYLPYIAVWITVVSALMLVAIQQSHRSTGLGGLAGLRGLVGLRLRQVSNSTWAAIAVAIGLIISLHLALVGEKPLTNSHKRADWSSQYQAKYGHWQYKPQPSIIEVHSQVDIYPHKQMADFKVKFTLMNHTNEPIEQLLIGRYGNFSPANITIDNAKLELFDTELNQGIYQLNEPLLAGQRLEMTTQFSYAQPKLWPHRSHQVVKPQFSYLRSHPLLPVIGYQQDYLTEQPVLLTQLETVISTDKAHHAISQGELVRHYRHGDRAFFHYQAKGHMSAMPTWVSIPFEVVTREFANVQINLFTPSSAWDDSINSEIHFDAVADTFSWFEQNIASVAAVQMNIVAKPDVGSSISHPQLMLLNHTAAFRLPKFDNLLFDQRYGQSVYLSAQQLLRGKWFRGKVISNQNILDVRLMAKYIELLLVEQRYGKAAGEQMVVLGKKRIDSLPINKSQTDEAVVVTVAKLRESLGDEVIIATMKSFWHSPQIHDGLGFIEALNEQLAAKGIVDSVVIDVFNR